MWNPFKTRWVIISITRVSPTCLAVRIKGKRGEETHLAECDDVDAVHAAVPFQVWRGDVFGWAVASDLSVSGLHVIFEQFMREGSVPLPRLLA